MTTSRPESRRRRASNGRYVTKLTDEVIELVCLALKGGATIEAAGAYAGIARRTYYRWLEAGRNDDGTPTERRFVHEIDRAIAEFEVTRVARIGQAGDWRADAWLLERRLPQSYGQVSRVNLGGTEDPLRVEHNTTHTIDLSVYTDEELKELHRLTKKGIDLPEHKGGEVLQLPTATARR